MMNFLTQMTQMTQRFGLREEGFSHADVADEAEVWLRKDVFSHADDAEDAEFLKSLLRILAKNRWRLPFGAAYGSKSAENLY